LSAKCSVSLKRKVNFFMVSLYHFLGICKVELLMASLRRQGDTICRVVRFILPRVLRLPRAALCGSLLIADIPLTDGAGIRAWQGRDEDADWVLEEWDSVLADLCGD